MIAIASDTNEISMAKKSIHFSDILGRYPMTRCDYCKHFREMKGILKKGERE